MGVGMGSPGETKLSGLARGAQNDIADIIVRDLTDEGASSSQAELSPPLKVAAVTLPSTHQKKIGILLPSRTQGKY